MIASCATAGNKGGAQCPLPRRCPRLPERTFGRKWHSATSKDGRAGRLPEVDDATDRALAREAAAWRDRAEEVLARHLRGDATIGIYPLLPGDTCTLLACDFDQGTWALDALAYLDACHHAEVPAALERSRSGNGAHVWVFFEGEVPASTARSLGTSLLREAMAARAELDLSSYDRFFPSQDFMPKGSFGNLIALPLQGECLQRGTTAFLDPTTMRPWPDQWALLGRPPDQGVGEDAGSIVAASRRRARLDPRRPGQGRRAAAAGIDQGTTRGDALHRAIRPAAGRHRRR